MVERQDDEHEAPDHLVIDTTRVGDRQAALPGIRAGAYDRGRIAVERVEVHDAGGRRAIDEIGAEDVVDGLDDEAVAHAQPLVRRLDRELVAAIGEALVEEVEALEAQIQGRVRLGFGARRNRLALAGLRAGEGSIDTRALVVAPGAVGIAAHGRVDLVRFRRSVGADRRDRKQRSPDALQRELHRNHCRGRRRVGERQHQCWRKQQRYR